ncbi:MAG: glycoside hydrolase family 15 protein [Patescibacteria group bacterium]
MPKSLVLGNGNILVSLDSRGQVRDFYFPYVGLDNHAPSGCVHRMGVWVDGQFSWFTNNDWNISVDYKKETMVSEIRAVNDRLELSIFFNDIVYNESNIFIRKITVHNKHHSSRTVKLYINQQFQISHSSFGNTAYYQPGDNALIHYKGRRLFFISGQTANGSFDDYSIGLAHSEGKEGTWRDAEDGKLSQNGIEHGSVDSTLGFTLALAADEVTDVYYWIIAAHTLKEARLLNLYVLKKTPPHLLKSTSDFWKAWVNKRRFVFYGLDEKVGELFKKSLLIMRTHADNRGSIIASGDSSILQYGRDTYSYMWPRDGAFATLAFDKAGYFDLGTRFYSFCNEVLTDEGYLLHKYNSDRSLGSSWHPWVRNGVPQLAIQEDETAITIFTLWEHYIITRNLEFIESIYNSYIKKAADFLTEYRDKKTGLPGPSYDLWEERNGISCFTSSAVYGGLVAASKFAFLLGKQTESKKYHKAADEIQAVIVKYFFNEKEGTFSRMITTDSRGNIVVDRTIDASSAYGVFRFGVLSPFDERLLRAMMVAREKLRIQSSVGGHARYEGDVYYGVDPNFPGNPWFISTLWFAQYEIARAESQEDLNAAKQVLDWVVKNALPSGILSEQLNPYSGEPLSVRPLTWSHAEFVLTVIAYLEKLQDLGVCQTCYPVSE